MALSSMSSRLALVPAETGQGLGDTFKLYPARAFDQHQLPAGSGPKGVAEKSRGLVRGGKGLDRYPSGLGLVGDDPGFLSYRNKQARVGVETRHQRADFLVADRAERAQLQHIAQHDDQPLAGSAHHPAVSRACCTEAGLAL